MGDAGAVIVEGVDLALVDMDTVGSQDFGLKQPLLLDVRDNRHIVIAAHILDFYGGLGQVRVQGDVEFSSQLGGGF